MKGIVLNRKLAFAVLFSYTFVSCDRQHVYQAELVENVSINQKSSELAKVTLASQIAGDAEFIEYVNVLEDFFMSMPKREIFIDKYRDEEFSKGGESYFLYITGYTDIDIKERLSLMSTLLYNLYQKYPSIKYNGSNYAYIREVIESALSQLYQNNQGKMSCKECVKVWHPRMIMATIGGGVIGGASGGFFGAWGGAVMGFAGAGWGAVDCLSSAGC